MTAAPDISPSEPRAEPNPDPPAVARARATERDRDDPVLAALAQLTGLLGAPISADALATGLPLHENRMTPELAQRAARRAGFAARLVRRRRLAAISPLNLPCLLALADGGACLLVGLTADGVAELVLPETGGAARVKVADLEPRFTGLVLLLSPRYAPDARADAAPQTRAGDWFWGALSGLWPIYGHVAIAAFAINLLGIAGSIYTMNVYDRVVPNNAIETLWVLTIGVMIAYGFDFLLRTVRAYFVDAAGKGADAVLAGRLFEQVMAMRLEARPASTGALASNLREYESLREFFTSATLVTLVDLPFVFVYVTVAWLIAGHVALVPLLALPVVIVVGLALQVPLRRAVERNQAEAAQKHAILVESIEGIETLKVAGAEGRSQRLWERFVAAAARSSMTGRVIANLAVNFTLLATNVASVTVILIGVSEIAAGHLTMGALIAATILTGRAMTPLGQIATLLVRVNQSMVALKALDRLMQAPRERPHDASYVRRPNLRGQIEFSEIAFAYPAGGAPGAAVLALRGVSLFIGAGERVGIVGRIGSGKSTLARLIAGLYLPQQGSILIDGTDLRQIDPAELRRQIGYVPQDAFLVFGSVRDNITVGWPQADDEAVLRAATVAGVDDFVKQRPRGYDLAVGERGQYLSGGQRAAVTIARALLADPPILLLDEPTGAMDNTSEQRFRQRLEQILPGKTLVLVTHRGSMLALVDRLIVLDQGRIVADGPKQKVLEDLAAGTIRAATGKAAS